MESTDNNEKVLSTTHHSNSAAVRENDQQGRTRIVPSCANCRNHDIISPVKGHKRYCSFRLCTCVKCEQVAERRKIMVKQTALRRAEKQDRLRLKAGLPVPGYEEAQRPSKPDTPCSSFQSSSSSAFSTPTPDAPIAAPSPHTSRDDSNTWMHGFASRTNGQIRKKYHYMGKTNQSCLREESCEKRNLQPETAHNPPISYQSFPVHPMNYWWMNETTAGLGAMFRDEVAFM